MNLLLFIMFGALIGWLTSVIMKTSTRQGVLGDMVLGILGALTGGLLIDLFGRPGIVGFNIYSILIILMGGVILVLIGRTLTKAF